MRTEFAKCCLLAELVNHYTTCGIPADIFSLTPFKVSAAHSSRPLCRENGFSFHYAYRSLSFGFHKINTNQ